MEPRWSVPLYHQHQIGFAKSSQFQKMKNYAFGNNIYNKTFLLSLHLIINSTWKKARSSNRALLTSSLYHKPQKRKKKRKAYIYTHGSHGQLLFHTNLSIQSTINFRSNTCVNIEQYPLFSFPFYLFLFTKFLRIKNLTRSYNKKHGPKNNNPHMILSRKQDLGGWQVYIFIPVIFITDCLLMFPKGVQLFGTWSGKIVVYHQVNPKSVVSSIDIHHWR